MNLSLLDRIRGCLLGGAIGDALGAPVEFDTLAHIRARHGPAGVTDLEPAYGHLGAITDDTQMTLFTAEGLVVAGPAASPDVRLDAIRDAYLRWLTTQGGPPTPAGGWLLDIADLHHRRAPGTTCLTALHAGGTGTTDQPANTSKGCGGIMRIAPIGLACADPGDLATRAAALTHGHPSGWASAGAFAETIAAATHGATLPDAVTAGRDWLRALGPPGAETLTALDTAIAASHDAPVTAETLESVGAGWTGEEALAIAVWCVLAEPDPEACLTLAVTHSGDSDSTGSLAGQLLGTHHGPDAVPDRWRTRIELTDVIERLAAELHAVADPTPARGRPGSR